MPCCIAVVRAAFVAVGSCANAVRELSSFSCSGGHHGSIETVAGAINTTNTGNESLSLGSNSSRRYDGNAHHQWFPVSRAQSKRTYARVDDHLSNLLFALGGGTGASIRSNRISAMNWDLQRRMRYQDHAVIVLLLAVYFVTLFFGLSFTYWRSHNTAPVLFYADPRSHNVVSPDGSLHNFLDAFCQTPKTVQLQVTGFLPVQEDIAGSVQWQGENLCVAFTFALDLSLWVVPMNGGSMLNNDNGGIQPASLERRIVGEDMVRLRNFLAMDQNDLATVEIEKQIAWPEWEELATNIKLRIRQCGFHGIIGIHRTDTETVTVYKNKVWANFMHNRLTKVLCALSVVGCIFYVPYMWLRCSKLVVRSCYCIDVSISDYWDFIADRLTVNGFEVQPSSTTEQMSPAPPSLNVREQTPADTRSALFRP